MWCVFPYASLHLRCDTVSQNQPGTEAYWRSAYNEFEATSMQQNHGFGNTPALFHTGSFAEYHEYDLRCLLATYVAQLTCASDTESEDAARNIMTDDKSFVSAVQTYKHVVTQYFAAKTEIWMTLFMKPVFGVTGGNLVNEFAKARGAIHFHSCLQSAHRALDVCSRQICHLSLAVADALMEVDEYINEHYDDNDHKSADFPIKPSTIFTTDGMSERQRFCNVTEVGEAVMDKYEKTVKKARIECQSVVGKSLMKDFGYNACHTGNGPGDYIQPVGLKTDDYMQHEDEDGKRMQTSKDVVDRKQLKRKRWQSDFDAGRCQVVDGSKMPFAANSDHLNHAFTHSCSDYCLKRENRKVMVPNFSF